MESENQSASGFASTPPTCSPPVSTFVTLKDGIKYGDGTVLDATLYAAQLNRLLTIGPSCPNDVADTLAVPYVKSIEAPDAKTIVITLKNPVAYFIQILATAPWVASDPKAFPADKCNLFPDAPIYGVGPWYISQYTKDEQIVLDPGIGFGKPPGACAAKISTSP